MQKILVVMAIPRTTLSHITDFNPFTTFRGTFATHSSLLSFTNPFSFLELASGIRPPKTTILAPFHSTCSNRDRPRSMIEKITTLDDALKLFDEMTQKKRLPSIVKFNQLLQAVTKMKHYSCSIDLFKQMAAIRVPVSVCTTNIVIKCFCQMSCTSEGFAVLGYGFKRGAVPNVCICNTLLDGLILEDRILEAERLFKKLIEQELCEPDVVTYATMIKGLCKFGNNETAIALLRLMDERGCKHDVFTYSIIIDSLCKDEMVDHALKVYKQMIFHKGIQPTIVTYNSLIRGLCNLCRWDDASKLLKEMQISPDVQTFNILVNAFCKEGKVEDAEAVMNIMVERGKDPNVVTYTSLIDGYCLCGEMSKAREVFDLMGRRGMVPDVVTYSCLLNGYCKNSKLDEAMHLFNEMTKKGLKPNVVTYNTMLQGLFGVGRCGTAHILFDAMQAHTL